MGFSFKKIDKIIFNKLQFNKKFNLELNNPDIKYYLGENIPLNSNNLFDPYNDDISDSFYKRLIFNSIKSSFFKPFNSSGFIESSSLYEYYPQTLIYSGSYNTDIRKISNVTGSSFQNILNGYNNNIIYDDIYNYDDNIIFDNNIGGKLLIISIPRKYFYNNLEKNSILIELDNFYIRDDGRGNLFNFINEENYQLYLNTQKTEYEYIGNVIYSWGLLIITNPNYICLFNVPPTAINDYYNINNINKPLIYPILSNDYDDCNSIDYSSLEIISTSSVFFDYNIIDNQLHIIENQKSYIPGNYEIKYKFKNNKGIYSNIGTFNINIFANPLNISNININKLCLGNTGSYDITFNINDGVPLYSYSLNDIDYQLISSDFLNVSLSLSLPYNIDNIWVKDYIGNKINYNINPYYDLFSYKIIQNPKTNCESGSIVIENLNDFFIEYTINNNGPYLPNRTTYLNEYENIIKISNGICEQTEIIYNNEPENINIDYNIINTRCSDSNDGKLIINNISGGTPPYNLSLTKNDIIYNDFNNLPKGIYNLNIIDNNNCSYDNIIEIGSPLRLSYETFIGYEECYTNIAFNVVGGTPPYIYSIITPQTLYELYDQNLISMYLEGLRGFEGNIIIKDSNNCIITGSITIPSRKYIYSGSYCEN
jgi:hypothetical protein